MFSGSVRYLFYDFISQWMKRSKHGLFVFPPKKTPISRRHCSIGKSCCSMTSKLNIVLFLESSRAWSFPAKRSPNQPKAARVCIRSINQSNRSIFVRLFLFCSRVFISRSYKNRSIPELSHNGSSYLIIIEYLSLPSLLSTSSSSTLLLRAI